MLLTAVVLCMAYLSIHFAYREVHRLAEEEHATPSAAHSPTALAALHRRLAAESQDRIAPRDPPTRIGPHVIHELRDAAAEDVARLGYRAALWLDPAGEAAAHDATYDVWSHDGTRHFQADFDGTDDGILWETPCPVDTALVDGCAMGLFLRATLDSDDVRIDTPIVLALHVGE